jgi:hypothetical protein
VFGAGVRIFLFLRCAVQRLHTDIHIYLKRCATLKSKKNGGMFALLTFLRLSSFHNKCDHRRRVRANLLGTDANHPQAQRTTPHHRQATSHDITFLEDGGGNTRNPNTVNPLLPTEKLGRRFILPAVFPSTGSPTPPSLSSFSIGYPSLAAFLQITVPCRQQSHAHTYRTDTGHV